MINLGKSGKKEGEERIKEARRLFKRGEYRKAIVALKRVIEIKPDTAEAWYNMGIAYYELGEYNMAIEAYEKAIKIKKDLFGAWTNIGFAYHELGKYRAAINAYERAIEIKPDLAEAWYCIGIAFYKLGEHREAENSYERAIEIKPDLAESRNKVEFTYYKLDKKFKPKRKRRIDSFAQIANGIQEVDTPEICPDCKSIKWTIKVENNIKYKICNTCGREFIAGRTYREYQPLGITSYRAPSLDDMEKTLEKDYEKGRR